MSPGYLGDRIITVLRKPSGIKSLRPLIVQNIFKTVIAKKADRLFEFGGEFAVFAVDDGIDVFLEQDLKQRTGSATGARAKGASDFRRKVAENGYDAGGIGSKSIKKMTVGF